jgi:hypothetical protein
MISQTDIAVAVERAWREAMPDKESATRNAMLRAAAPWRHKITHDHAARLHF